MTFSSFQEASKSDHQVPAAPAEPEAVVEPEVETEAEPEPQPVAAGEDDLIYDKLDDEYDPDAPAEAEEFIDESNPFFAAKKEDEGQPAAAKKKEEVDSSRAAEDILRKMMERRRASR
jgi:hypothetical protein